MKRFHVWAGQIEPDDEGEWVRREEVAAHLARLRGLVEEWREDERGSFAATAYRCECADALAAEIERMDT